ncbi:LysM peptidoglycan-binding domain-containing protein, partial [Companilactobacillus farciminis]
KVLSIALVSTMALTAISATTKTAQAAVQLDSNHVQVEAGDTYKSIAENAGVTIAELEQANGREVGGYDLIFPGETVTLPGATTAAATDTTTQAAQDITQTAQATQTTEDTSYQAQNTTQATTQSAATTTQSTTQTGTSQGTFKISF